MAAYNLVYQIIIVSTSLIGSYLIVRGISLYVGNFPNELDLHDDIIAGNLTISDIEPKIWFSLIVVTFLWIIGMVHQCRGFHAKIAD